MASSFMQQFAKKRSILKRSSKKYLEQALYKKLFSDGGEEKIVREKLNQFLKSHKSAYKWEVGHTLKTLRSRKLYGPVIKLSETMEKRGMKKTVSDQAIHLDLIAKSRGLPAAEAYFITLPESSKNHLTYGALLNCYCKDSMTIKAQSLFEKMKELNLELSSMPYNILMTLYLKIGTPRMVPQFIQEMKAADIMPDTYTYNVWMRALAAVNDISGVERVIDEMKRDGRVSGDWTTYSNLASIYADAGLFEKAEKALKELETKNACKKISAYEPTSWGDLMSRPVGVMSTRRGPLCFCPEVSRNFHPSPNSFSRSYEHYTRGFQSLSEASIQPVENQVERESCSLNSNPGTNKCSSDLENNQTSSITHQVNYNLKISERHDFAIIFTCKVCDTRSVKTVCRKSYDKGVVVARCNGCNNLHLIADRLGWFGEPGSVEEFLAARGEEVKKGSSDSLNLTLEDLVGKKDL